jgi:hypothetical protein
MPGVVGVRAVQLSHASLRRRFVETLQPHRLGDACRRRPVEAHPQRARIVFPGASGSMCRPRNMSGRAISRMEALIVASSMPIVVFDRTIHL